MNLSLAAIRRVKRKRFRKILPKAIPLEPKFQSQNNFVNDTSRFIVAQCSRRAGKSSGLAIRFHRAMEKYPGSTSRYLSLTFDSAKSIMWPVLQEMDDSHKLGYRFIESNLTVLHPNGAKLRLMGADQKNFIKRIRGVKAPAIAIDEAQDFGSHLESLVDDVVIPTMTDYEDSWLAITGTPGPVPRGYWYDVSYLRKYGFSHHAWTLLENPYLPNPEKFINELKEKKCWPDNHPTLLREWRNQWVLDLESLWIRYNEEKDDFTHLPPGSWQYILGVDLGFEDCDALALLAYSEASPITYLVEELVTAKQGITELVSQINFFRGKCDITKIVVDEGALGKKLAEEMRRRHKLPLHPADKTRKQETVGFLNDAMRLGHFKAKVKSRFVQDSYEIQIDKEKTTEDKIKLKGPHSDIIDAVIYAFKESPAYIYEKPIPQPSYGTKEWANKETERMFEEELERALREKDEDPYWRKAG